MSAKIFCIKEGDISDGFHTFGELYDHRTLLFLSWIASDGRPGTIHVSKNHFPGWDLVAVQISPEEQISYHVPICYRDIVNQLPRSEDVYVFDGHTSEDVADTLRERLRRQ